MYIRLGGAESCGNRYDSASVAMASARFVLSSIYATLSMRLLASNVCALIY